MKSPPLAIGNSFPCLLRPHHVARVRKPSLARPGCGTRCHVTRPDAMRSAAAPPMLCWLRGPHSGAHLVCSTARWRSWRRRGGSLLASPAQASTDNMSARKEHRGGSTPRETRCTGKRPCAVQPHDTGIRCRPKECTPGDVPPDMCTKTPKMYTRQGDTHHPPGTRLTSMAWHGARALTSSSQCPALYPKCSARVHE